MPDLVRGETFADGETVNAERLHKLVDNATLVDGAVTTSRLANGAVTTEKLATGAVIQSSGVALAKDKLLVGDAAGKGSPLTVGPELDLDATAGLVLAAKGVSSAKIADGAVGTAQLAAIDPSPAGTYGDATHVPSLTVDATGRITAASGILVDFPTIAKIEVTQPIPPAGQEQSLNHGFLDQPELVTAELVCADADAGYQPGDRIPIADVSPQSDRDDQAFFSYWNTDVAAVGRWNVAASLYVIDRTDRSTVRALNEAKWLLRIAARN